MCDCYEAKCEKCDTMIPIHIADYNYDREDVKVFCEKHIPKNDVSIFEITKECKHFKDLETGWKCGIRLLDIEPNHVGVYPNTGAEYKVGVL